MADLQIANKCNLFSSGFTEKKPRKFAQNSRNFTKNLLDFGKKLKDLKKTQGYEALLGLLGLQKVHKKQACPRTSAPYAARLTMYVLVFL